jgi:release factor glutamine methyltransferase
MIPFTWDVTTLVLKKALDEGLPPRAFDYLDMGCGHVGLLGQYVKRRRPDARVVACDVYPEFADCARENISANRVDIEVRQSDLFGSVPERFDLITTNLPYKATSQTESAAPSTRQWDKTTFSGDGTETSRAFLEHAHAHLTPDGRIFFGVNCFYLPEPVCRDLVAASGYAVEWTVRRRLNTAIVFVLASKRFAA